MTLCLIILTYYINLNCCPHIGCQLKVEHFQESGQISITDFVRVTSTEWYALTVILCQFSVYL